MATKDITRFLHQPAKQYRGVRLQQGRPLLDSDYNEGARGREEDRRLFLLDVFGRAACPDEGFTLGRPVPADEPLLDGQTLEVRTVRLNGQSVRVYPVSIRPGSIYVGGMRFELGVPEHIAFQRDYLQLKAQNLPAVSPLVSSPLLRSPVDSSPSEIHHVSLDSVPGGTIASIPLHGEPGINLPDFNIVQKRSVLDSPPTDSPDYPEFHYFYYLNAWEQPVSAVEDDEFQEKGLAGPDTTVRIKRMRRVEVLPVPAGTNCDAAFFEFLIPLLEAGNATLDLESYELRSLGRLQLTFLQPEVDPECPPCTPDPGAQYLGAENQTLRILQTRDSSQGESDAFVWAVDNGAPLYKVSVTGLSATSSPTVIIEVVTPPKDAEHALGPNRVVEIIPFGAILEGAEGLRPGDPYFQKIADELGVFVKIRQPVPGTSNKFVIDADPVRIEKLRQLVSTWDPNHPAAAQLNIPGPNGGRPFYMRVWHKSEDGNVELPLLNGRNAPLGKTGIVPVFHRPGRRGDYWTATLRVDARHRIVPLDLFSNSTGVPPHGPRHFYTPLALLSGVDQVVATVTTCCEQGRRISDRGCAQRTVGDGIMSFGDFDTIQKAVDSLPLEGGLIEVRPGFYPHALSLQQRHNITIRGCGPNTVLQTPVSSPGPALIAVQQSSKITIANLTLNATGQKAIAIEDSSEIGLEKLSLAAGSLVSGAFEPDTTSNEPLIDVTRSARVSFEKGRIDVLRRPALVASDSSALEFRNIESRGSLAAATVPNSAMWTFASTTQGVVFADSSIEAFAQVGVDAAGADVELRGLDIFASVLGVMGATTRSAISVVDAARARIERCRITMGMSYSIHAAVVVHGQDVTVEDNEIETLLDNGVARAWGGLHVLGGSQRVEIRRNRIKGGLGHGITLGSAAWTDGTTQERHGPGFDQLTDQEPPVVTGDLNTGGSGLTAVIDAAIEQVLISENLIENMGTNGIAPLALLGVVDDLIEIQHAVIERNTIRNNCLQIADPGDSPILEEVLPFGTGVLSPAPGPTATANLELRVFAHAGISLPVVSGSLDVRGNVITDNGTAEIELPVNGIFVLIGDSIVISDNRIANNGGRPGTSGPAPLTGVRAGIAVMLAGSGTRTSITDLKQRLGTIESTEPEFLLEGGGAAARVTNNTVQQPEGRALHLVGAGPIAIEGNFFSSQGNHAAGSDALRAQIGDVVFVENLGAPYEAHEPHGNLDKIADFAHAGWSWLVTYLRNDLSSPNRLFLALGGATSFQNNQVIYDWDLRRVPSQGSLSFFPTALLSCDTVSANANQFAQRLVLNDTSPPDIPQADVPLVAQVMVIASSAQVVRNRFSADQKSVLLSLLIDAEHMGIALHNQCTYEIQTNHSIVVLSKVRFQPETANPIEIDGNQFLFKRNALPTVPFAHEDLLKDRFPFD